MSKFMNRIPRLLAVLAVSVIASGAWAQAVTVQDAWARATLPVQKTSGAFMVLKSAQALRLVGVSSPVAGVAEMHEMKMDGNIMRMRGVPAIELPAGKAVELKPGGYHLMLKDLKQPLKTGSKIPLTLRFESADRKMVEQKIELEVRAEPPAIMAGHAEPGNPHDGHKAQSGHQH